MPPLVPGGEKLDRLPARYYSRGVTKDLEPHQRKLKEEDDKLAGRAQDQEERLRKSLRIWDKLERGEQSPGTKERLELKERTKSRW